jgi:hypothetical protein
MNITTQTSTTDSLELLFYDLQFVDQYGVFPRNQIMSGITIPTTPTGIQTVTLPSTLSFSGGGGGFYAFILKYSNPTVAAPTVRYATPTIVVNNQSYAYSFGLVRNNAGTALLLGNRAGTVSGSISYWLTNQTTPETITSADIVTRFNTTTVASTPGFSLNTIK